MNSRTFLHSAVLFFLSFVILPSLQAEDLPAAEKAKIEALITHVGTLKDATFVRNGSDYDAKAAAKFLRGKWESNAKEIKTAADFIAKAATRSSTSGKPYLIRIKGSPETPCAEYLTAQLKKLEEAAKGK